MLPENQTTNRSDPSLSYEEVEKLWQQIHMMEDQNYPLFQPEKYRETLAILLIGLDLAGCSEGDPPLSNEILGRLSNHELRSWIDQIYPAYCAIAKTCRQLAELGRKIL